jgi:hypothetical protein
LIESICELRLHLKIQFHAIKQEQPSIYTQNLNSH